MQNEVSKKLRQATGNEMKFLYEHLKEIIRLHEKQKKPIETNVMGINLWIYPKVFCPNLGKASSLLLEELKLKRNSAVLDMGTGSGIYAIFCIYDGASKVVATDISPYAINCAKRNVKMHKMSGRIEIREGDVFGPIRKKEKFDLILANLPFFRKGGFKFNGTYIEKMFVDENAKIIKSMLRDSRKHLNPDGKIIMIYGITGFVSDLLRLMKKYRYKYRILATRNYLCDEYYLLELLPF